MYQERIVIFIDILGWKETVETLGFDEVNSVYNEFSRMIKKMNESINSSLFHFSRAAAKRVGIELENKTLTFNENEQDIIYFSDCVVWSYPTEKLSNINYLFVLVSISNAIDTICSVLFAKGILIRGGISTGTLYQENNKVFGTGLIKAYLLEQKARYPRIAFDREMIVGKLSEAQMRFIKTFLTYNTSGFFCLDYFKKIKLANEFKIENKDETYEIALRTFVDPVVFTIQRGINHPHAGVRAKYEWLKSKLLAIPNPQFDVNF